MSPRFCTTFSKLLSTLNTSSLFFRPNCAKSLPRLLLPRRRWRLLSLRLIEKKLLVTARSALHNLIRIAKRLYGAKLHAVTTFTNNVSISGRGVRGGKAMLDAYSGSFETIDCQWKLTCLLVVSNGKIKVTQSRPSK